MGIGIAQNVFEVIDDRNRYSTERFIVLIIVYERNNVFFSVSHKRNYYDN